MDVTATTSAEAVDITASSIMRAMSMSPLKPISSCATYGATRPARKTNRKKSPHRIVHYRIFMPDTTRHIALPCLVLFCFVLCVQKETTSCILPTGNSPGWNCMGCTMPWRNTTNIHTVELIFVFIEQLWRIKIRETPWQSKTRQDKRKQVSTTTRTRPLILKK